MKTLLILCILLVPGVTGKKNADKFDLSHVKILRDLGEYQLRFDKHTITFDSTHGNIKIPLDYERSIADFNFSGTYKIVDENDEEYYFKFGWMHFQSRYSVFSYVNWIDKTPEKTTDFKKYRLFACSLNLRQKGSISICTIGDSQTWWGDAQNFRRSMKQLNPALYFVGSRTDIYGYPHEGEGGNSTTKLLERASYIPKADYYTLLIGTNDWKGEPQKSSEVINEVVSGILSKYPRAKILYLTPLPCSEERRNAFNETLKELLFKRYADNSSVRFVDVGGKMKENPNWLSDYFPSDGLHQNEQGVDLMAKIIVDAVGAWKK